MTLGVLHAPPFQIWNEQKLKQTYKKNDNNNNKNINRNENSKSYLFYCRTLYPNHTMMLRGTKKYITKNNWNWNNWSCYTSAVKSGYCCNSLLQTWFLYSVSLDENYHRMFARMLRQTYALICTLFSSFLVLSEWNRISKALRINRHAIK